MRIDTTLIEKSLLRAGERAGEAEALGLDTVWCTETGSDVFLQAYEAARSTQTVGVGTAIAVALARSPMTVAYSAWGIAEVSGGRFTLGLGSQVKSHIERRFSMPWGKPVDRMREYILALRAIWGAWQTDEPLRFEGEFYTHTLMNSFWAPPATVNNIDIHIAAVGPAMLEMAAENANGILLHAFTNREYLETVTYPAIEKGLAKSGRNYGDIEISLPLFMAMGDTDEEIADRTRETVAQLAFYASTPAYRPVLEAIGYGDLQPKLSELMRAGDTGSLSRAVPADFVDHFAIAGRPEEMPALAHNRLGTRPQRTSSYYGWPTEDPQRLMSIFAEFRKEM